MRIFIILFLAIIIGYFFDKLIRSSLTQIADKLAELNVNENFSLQEIFYSALGILAVGISFTIYGLGLMIPFFM